MASTTSQTAEFIAKFSPTVARQFRAARTRVRKYFPRGYELVYDNYNALGCGYSATTRPSGVIISVVAYPKWVTLFFFHGKNLPDPDGLLRGSGMRIRSLRLQPFSLMQSQSVRDLIEKAIEPSAPEFRTAPRMATIVKSVSVKQRPRQSPASSKGLKKTKNVSRGKARAV
jgi:hypothetical protein